MLNKRRRFILVLFILVFILNTLLTSCIKRIDNNAKTPTEESLPSTDVNDSERPTEIVNEPEESKTPIQTPTESENTQEPISPSTSPAITPTPTESENTQEPIPSPILPTVNPNAPIFLEYEEIAIMVDDITIELTFWEGLSVFDSIFGDRVNEERDADNEFPYEGTEFIHIEYQDTSVDFLTRGDNKYYLYQMSTMSSKVQITRGLKIGDSKQKLIQLYPELSKFEHENVESIRVYLGDETYGITFYIKNDIIYKTKIWTELA